MIRHADTLADAARYADLWLSCWLRDLLGCPRLAYGAAWVAFECFDAEVLS